MRIFNFTIFACVVELKCDNNSYLNQAPESYLSD